MLDVTLQGVTLHVEDVERSLAFYRRIPGLVVDMHIDGTFALLNAGTMRLGLLRMETGTFHVELETEDLDALYAHLKAAGFPVEEPIQHDYDERDFRMLDPDGYEIEFGGREHQLPAAHNG